MRQRLSSEPDRYRGRRRVPTPPRSRYAAAVTGAFVGAGMVAMGAGAFLPDAGSIPDATLAKVAESSQIAQNLADRDQNTQVASRNRAAREVAHSVEQQAADAWLLPVKGYRFVAPFGVVGDKLHPGIDLAAPEGSAVRAVHAGTVKVARWMGGYGYTVVIDHGDGLETMYGHQASLEVSEGQQVKAGDKIGLVGNSGLAYSPQLYLEIRSAGEAVDPIPFLEAKGVNIKLEVEAVYGGIDSAA
ncbi:hypothetical protein GCM10010124_03670 [Pilimelia terevasa]|uniref:M23ase beta-sheet core domain-containing protein n=1 Tax=Pilimelia terevasa TaxID=53372 RepID=A0A8J3FDV3_9ACTN|nr:M23 family metallopeptidase [Pilimelia terevasa]GGK14389.1 hypothetical protein GCM10010124_03670 [Pilimelia terevasa]